MTQSTKYVRALGLALSLVALGSQGLDGMEEPYMSLRTGFRCSQCHVNRTGGGGRNEFGSVYAQTRLSMKRMTFAGRSLNDFLAVGANLRVLATGTPSEATPRTSVRIPEANLQLEARVIPDILAVYIDQTFGPGGASNREAFVLAERLPLNGYVKAGKFLLPYGLRLVDDAEYIRRQTGFSYATPDLGVEVGVEPSTFSVFASLTNGTQGADEVDDGKQVTGTMAWILPWLRVGGSASRNHGAASRRDVIGGFGGFNLGRFTVLGELDLIRVVPDTNASGVCLQGGTCEQFAAYVEGNLLLVRGFNTKVTYGFLDPNRDIKGDAQIRMRFGFEVFPIQFLQISAFYTLLDDPEVTTDLNRVSLELHAFF